MWELIVFWVLVFLVFQAIARRRQARQIEEFMAGVVQRVSALEKPFEKLSSALPELKARGVPAPAPTPHEAELKPAPAPAIAPSMIEVASPSPVPRAVPPPPPHASGLT